MTAEASLARVDTPIPITPGPDGELEATREILREKSDRIVELDTLVQDLQTQVQVANDLAARAYDGRFQKDSSLLVLEIQELKQSLRIVETQYQASLEKNRSLEHKLKTTGRPSSEKVASEMARLRSEVNQLKIANASLIDEYQHKFQLQERWVRDAIKIIEPLDQTGPEIQDIMHMLRTRPQELRADITARKISYHDAFDELAPILIVALKQVAKSHVKEVAKTKVCIRAEYLTLQMQTRKAINTQTAIDLITGREMLEKPVSRATALRAMELAALANPKLIFEREARKVARLVWRANEAPSM